MRKIGVILGLMGIIIIGAHQEEQKAKRISEASRKARIPSPTPAEKGYPQFGQGNSQTIERSRIRGYNFESGGWIYYTDEEIRRLREIQSFNSSGDYIYTPGRQVPTREELIEEYIEENIERIIDEYGN